MPITNANLLLWIVALLGAYAVVFATWFAVSLPRADPVVVTDVTQNACSSDFASVFRGVLYAISACVLALGIFISFETRGVHDVFKSALRSVLYPQRSCAQ